MYDAHDVFAKVGLALIVAMVALWSVVAIGVAAGEVVDTATDLDVGEDDTLVTEVEWTEDADAENDTVDVVILENETGDEINSTTLDADPGNWSTYEWDGAEINTTVDVEYDASDTAAVNETYTEVQSGSDGGALVEDAQDWFESLDPTGVVMIGAAALVAGWLILGKPE